MPILKRGIDSSQNFTSLFQFHERLLLCTFLAQTIYTLLKRSLLKLIFLRLSSPQVKFCQISYVTFETTPRFLSKFCTPLQFDARYFLCYFLVQKRYTLLNRSSIKWTFLRLTGVPAKICQIPYSNFETTSRFCLKFCIPFQFHEV